MDKGVRQLCGAKLHRFAVSRIWSLALASDEQRFPAASHLTLSATSRDVDVTLSGAPPSASILIVRSFTPMPWAVEFACVKCGEPPALPNPAGHRNPGVCQRTPNPPRFGAGIRAVNAGISSWVMAGRDPQDESHRRALEEARRLRREQPPVREPALEDEEAEPDEDEKDGLGPRPGGG